MSVIVGVQARLPKAATRARAVQASTGSCWQAATSMSSISSLRT